MHIEKFTFALCLLAGVVIYIGINGVGWISRMLVPGLLLGVGIYVVVALFRALRK